MDPFSPNRLAFAILAICLISHPFAARADDSLQFTTLSGASISPLRSQQEKPAVVIFVTIDCPINNALAPEISHIYKHSRKLGVQFTLVHVDADLSEADARKHATDFSLKIPIVIDHKHLLVKAAKATITPETAVFDSKGKLVYHGRINDQWTDYGKRRAIPTEHNLRETLDALLAGKNAPKSTAPAVGCFIP